MKVGVDGVLVGCWAVPMETVRILDVGTGCGLIALIMAQRFPEVRITGIEIDEASVEEARENVMESPWNDRISIEHLSFSDMADGGRRFGMIVSNPPYFDSGVSDITTRREQARHQGELSPSVILDKGRRILEEGGGVAMIVPAELSEGIRADAESLGYTLIRKCLVRGHSDAPFKRVLVQFIKVKEGFAQKLNMKCEDETLTLEVAPGVPTEEYRELCKDFYLKF